MAQTGITVTATSAFEAHRTSAKLLDDDLRERDMLRGGYINFSSIINDDDHTESFSISAHMDTAFVVVHYGGDAAAIAALEKIAVGILETVKRQKERNAAKCKTLKGTENRS
jgi:hypothetical protein